MKSIEIENKFHNTRYTLKVDDKNYSEVEEGNEHFAIVKLSDGQVKAADKALCGMDCACGGINAAGEQIGRKEWKFNLE